MLLHLVVYLPSDWTVKGAGEKTGSNCIRTIYFGILIWRLSLKYPRFQSIVETQAHTPVLGAGGTLGHALTSSCSSASQRMAGVWLDSLLSGLLHSLKSEDLLS